MQPQVTEEDITGGCLMQVGASVDILLSIVAVADAIYIVAVLLPGFMRGWCSCKSGFAGGGRVLA